MPCHVLHALGWKADYTNILGSFTAAKISPPASVVFTSPPHALVASAHLPAYAMAAILRPVGFAERPTAGRSVCSSNLELLFCSCLEGRQTEQIVVMGMDMTCTHVGAHADTALPLSAEPLRHVATSVAVRLSGPRKQQQRSTAILSSGLESGPPSLPGLSVCVALIGQRQHRVVVLL